MKSNKLRILVYATFGFFLSLAGVIMADIAFQGDAPRFWLNLVESIFFSGFGITVVGTIDSYRLIKEYNNSPAYPGWKELPVDVAITIAFFVISIAIMIRDGVPLSVIWFLVSAFAGASGFAIAIDKS